jgi:hypothetical protein
VRAVAALELVTPALGGLLHEEHPGGARLNLVRWFRSPEQRDVSTFGERRAGGVCGPERLIETKLASRGTTEVLCAGEWLSKDGQGPRRFEQRARGSCGGAARCGLDRRLRCPPTRDEPCATEGAGDEGCEDAALQPSAAPRVRSCWRPRA